MKRQTVFQVSDKVICIAAAGGTRSFRPSPVVGQVYVVREVCESDDGEPGLRLVGVTGCQEGGIEVSHNPRRYRLLAEVQAANPKQKSANPEMVSIPVLNVKMMSGGINSPKCRPMRWSW